MHSDFITFQQIENIHVAMPAKAQSHCCGVRLGDHYMSLQRSTLDRMSCCTICFPFLGTTKYPQAPFIIAKVYPQKPLLHHAVCRYSHTSPAHPTRQLNKAFLISQQVITYWTHGGTYCPGVSSLKNQSLSDSSKTNHIP
jgi:hypothetical protein